MQPPSRVTHRTYRACRDLMSEQATLKIEAALDKVSEMLKADSVAAKDEDSAEVIRKSLVSLRGSRALIRTGFQRELMQRLEFQAPCGLVAKIGSGGKGLSLQADEVIDEFVAASSLAHLIDSECLDQMMPMHQRITRLLQQPTLRMAENPFSAPSVVSSLDAALTALPDVSQESRTLWFRRLTSLGGLGFHEVFVELNRILEEAGVDDLTIDGRVAKAGSAPSSQSQSRASGQANAAQAWPAEFTDAQQTQSALGADPSAPLHLLANNLASLVARLQRSSAVRGAGHAPGHTPGQGGWPALTQFSDDAQIGAALGIGPDGVARPPVNAAVDQRLMASLNALQMATAAMDIADAVAAPPVILRDAVPGYATGEVSVLDATTIELVSMLFEFVFQRRELRDEIKGVLGRLQIPMLKAAMVDRGFFSRKNHPARVLLNRLADAGLGWSPDDPHEAPLLAKIQEIVARVCSDFVDDLSVISDAHADFESFLASLEHEALPLLDVRTAEAEALDRERIAAQETQSIVDARIHQHALPEPVANFIQQTWKPHLTDELHLRGRDSEEFNKCVAALDDLVWSVLPKDQPGDRQQLSQRIPTLVRTLRNGLAEKSLADAAAPFFEQLFELHLGLLRGSEPVYVDPPLPPAPADEKEQALDDAFRDVIAQLARNQWVEILDDDTGSLRYARLTWISPQRTSYLFTTRLGGKASVFGADELLAGFRDGTIRLIDSEPIIDRALTGMFQQN